MRGEAISALDYKFIHIYNIRGGDVIRALSSGCIFVRFLSVSPEGGGTAAAVRDNCHSGSVTSRHQRLQGGAGGEGAVGPTNVWRPHNLEPGASPQIPRGRGGACRELSKCFTLTCVNFKGGTTTAGGGWGGPSRQDPWLNQKLQPLRWTIIWGDNAILYYKLFV